MRILAVTFSVFVGLLFQENSRADSGDWREKISVSVVLGVESEYVFRGQREGGASLQPGVELGAPLGEGNGYAGVWSNQELDGGPGDEIDFYAGFVFPLNPIVAFSTGTTYYWIMDKDEGGRVDSLEPFVGLFADLPLQPALSGYFDMEQEQLLAEISLGGEVPLQDPFSIGWSAAAGAAHAQKMGGKEGVSEDFWFFGMSAEFVWAVADRTRLSLHLDYSGREQSGFLDYLYGGVQVEMWR